MSDPEKTEAPKLEFTPEVFDPKKAELTAIAAEVALITADPSKMTKEDFELINSTKNKLVKARTRITKAGLAAREAANQYNRDVLSYEKELIAIIEPEEKRLKEIEASAKEYAMTEERKKTLPEFKEKLASIGDGVEVSDEELLALDPNGRTEYYNARLGAKLEADKVVADAKRAEEDAARAAEQKKLDDERAAIDADKKLAEEREWSARQSRILGLGFREMGNRFEFSADIVISKEDVRMLQAGAFEAMLEEVTPRVEVEKKRIADEAESKKQAEIKQAQESAAQAERERIEKEEAERKAADEREAAAKAAEEAERSRAEAYQKWLADNSYNPETDYIGKGEAVDVLYRKVSTYQHPTA